ncbi:MAG TPA: DUF3365 domain-containing protein [Bacteroidales bacterium]|nr:DUF3365 domain-containing protein [Bacteroidales bacterium]HRX97025.1 DUF3365 domain-containing protein [Bacteroidales bacterium]
MRYKFPNYIFQISILIIIAACSQQKNPVTAPSSEENKIIVAKGDAVAKALILTLKGEVKQAIDSNGVVEAIAVCNEKAIPLTQNVASLAEEGTEIKRTTSKPRNPANSPDEFEKEALKHFEKLIAAGESFPDNYTQKVVDGGDTSYYYYKPMKMEALCLLCHGTPETMAPEVKDVVAKLYPEDQAAGYQEGDFRGLIRVKFKNL